MKVVLNGTERMIEPPGTLAALLAVHHLRPMMVVVERNGEIVPRDRFDTEPVEENDRLEIVQMMAGG